MHDRRSEFTWSSGDFLVRKNNEGSHLNRSSGNEISLVSLVDENLVGNLYCDGNFKSYQFSRNYQLFRKIESGIAIPHSPYPVVVPSSFDALRKYCRENPEYKKGLELTIDYFLSYASGLPVIDNDPYRAGLSARTHSLVEQLHRNTKLSIGEDEL